MIQGYCTDLLFTSMYKLNHTLVVFNADSIQSSAYPGVQSFHFDLGIPEVKVLVFLSSNI